MLQYENSIMLNSTLQLGENNQVEFVKTQIYKQLRTADQFTQFKHSLKCYTKSQRKFSPLGTHQQDILSNKTMFLSQLVGSRCIHWNSHWDIIKSQSAVVTCLVEQTTDFLHIILPAFLPTLYYCPSQQQQTSPR